MLCIYDIKNKEKIVDLENLKYENNELFFDKISLKNLAEEYGTPLFVYSLDTIKNNFFKYENALKDIKHITCFALKTNSNSKILKYLKELGAGFDTVSGGEIFKVLNIGADSQKIVYAGVGKTLEEIDFAIKSNILMFNVESIAELNLINSRAILANKKVKISIRVNPNVDAKTHPYISTGLAKNKFGIDILKAEEVYSYATTLAGILPVGIHMHIGSQILETAPYKEAFTKIFDLYKKLVQNGIKLEYINIGGGLGICYDKKNQTVPSIESLIDGQIAESIKQNNLTLVLEPGRSIVGNAGILLTKVLFNKTNHTKNFVIVDAGMNDLARPSLYDAYHEIIPVINNKKNKIVVDVVGPICESTDFLAKDRELAELKEGEFLAIQNAGAYSFSMSSNYNSRLKPAETVIANGKILLARKRDTFTDLLLNEILP
jgi:diaminopimelate decarboxylase